MNPQERFVNAVNEILRHIDFPAVIHSCNSGNQQSVCFANCTVPLWKPMAQISSSSHPSNLWMCLWWCVVGEMET